MKHNLFRNFTALLLCGTMLAGVGCKDYDDDIDKINQRLDAMEIELSSIPEQIEAIKGTIPDLSDLTSRVEDLEGSIGDYDVAAELATLKQLESKLTSYVDQEIKDATTADALKATLDNYYATITALNTLEGKLSGIGGENQPKDVLAAIEAIKQDAMTWLGPQMTDYLKKSDLSQYGFVTKTEATSAAVEELVSQIEAAEGDYYDAIKAAIDNAISAQAAIKINKEQLDDELKALIEKITPLINRVAELEGRIQSLVYVPTRLDKKIMFEGASWIDFAGDEYYLGLKEQQSAVITFRVSPASVAEKIVKGFAGESGYNKVKLSIITEKVTRADADAEENFTIEKCELVEGKSGEFKVTATTGYKYGATANETLAIALNVKIAPAEDSESTQGIDYTTEFIGTDYNDGVKINDNLVIAKAEEGGEYTEIEGNYADAGGTLQTVDYNTKLPYYSTETVTFLEGFDVYYKDAEGNYSALSEMWNNTDLKTKVVAPTAKPTVDQSGHASSYDLTEATSFSIETSSTGLIGDKVTSGEYTYRVTAGDKTLNVAKVKQVVTIDTKNTAAVAETIAMNWQYAIASQVSPVYTKENVALTTKLPYADYNTIKDHITTKGTAGSLNVNEYAVTVTKNGQAVADGSITEADIELTADPSAEGDVQFIKVTLKGTLKVGGDYVVVGTYKKSDNTMFTITANVTVTGMPELAAYEIKATQLTYVDSYEFVLQENYASVLWNNNLKDAFGTKEAFETFIYGINDATQNANGGKATLSKDNKNIKVTFETAAVYGTSYKPSIKFTDATTGFAVTFNSNVTLVELAASLIKEDSYFTTGGYAVAETTLTGTSLTVSNKPLAGAYSFDKTYEGKVKIVYSINESEDDLDGLTTAPKIENNVLTWGDWKKLQLNVKADLVMVSAETRILDSETFVVAINDPVATGNITVDTEKAMIYVKDAQTLNIASLLKLAAQQGSAIDPEANVFDSTQADGLNANLKAALTGKAAYKTITGNNAITVDETSGVLTVQESGLAIQQPIVVTVQVDYTYKYGTRTTGEFTITVNPGTAPAQD